MYCGGYSYNSNRVDSRILVLHCSLKMSADMYYEETTPSNEIKGFTKSFVKRTKDKKEEDVNVKDLLSFQKEGKIIIGAKTCEKAFKANAVSKVYFASNVDDFMKRKIEHYAKLSGVETVMLEIDNNDLAQKLAKPFIVSVVTVRA